MNEFTKLELKGRNLFLTILELSNIKDYHFTEDAYNPVDCYYTTKDGKEIEVEIKVRLLVWLLMYMEATKLKAMKLIIKEGKAATGLYVNFVGNKCYIFPLSKITKSNGCFISTEYVKRTTAVYTGKKDKVMINIPITLAKVLEFKEGRWLLILK